MTNLVLEEGDELCLWVRPVLTFVICTTSSFVLLPVAPRTEHEVAEAAFEYPYSLPKNRVCLGAGHIFVCIQGEMALYVVKMERFFCKHWYLKLGCATQLASIENEPPRVR